MGQSTEIDPNTFRNEMKVAILRGGWMGKLTTYSPFILCVLHFEFDTDTERDQSML